MKTLLRNLGVAFLTFTFGVNITTFAGAYFPAPVSEVEQFLAKQEFDGEVSYPEVTNWELETFNLLEKEQWETRSRSAAPNWEGARYRFTIVKESYRSRKEASTRLSRLHEKPPDMSPEDDKAFPLRAGFNVDNTVYIVSCRVSMFHEYMKAFTRELEREVRERN
jgi:hypothetical protein